MFKPLTRYRASASPKVPPIGMMPPNRCSGAKEKPALKASVSRMEPAILIPPAAISSERIHF